jgi:hypothetical protein
MKFFAVERLTFWPKGQKVSLSSFKCCCIYYLNPRYNEMEDLNQLVDIYENIDSTAQITNYYQKIIRQDSLNSLHIEEYRPIGGIRFARYYQKKQLYDLAEKELLTAYRSTYRNAHIGIELKNFYLDMTEIFPRDYTWKEKFGLNLHTEIIRTDKTWMEVDYLDFYNYEASLTGAFSDDDVSKFIPFNEFLLEGTGKNLSIKEKVNDIENRAVENLNAAIALSGNIEPKLQILEALADIYVRQEKTNTLSGLYKKILLKKENKEVRNKYLNTLFYLFKFEEATHSLNILYQLNQISDEQLLLLAQNNIVLKKYKEAENILQSFKSQDNNLLELKYKYHILLLQKNKKWKKAINEINDYIEFVSSNFGESDNPFIPLGLYELARTHSYLHKDNLAMRTLNEAINEGFDLKNILKYDPAWEKLRTTKKWDNINLKN